MTNKCILFTTERLLRGRSCHFIDDKGDLKKAN